MERQIIDLSSLTTQTINVTSTIGTDTVTEDTFMEEVQTYTTYTIAKYLSKFWFPILVPIGFIGNVLSFLVMMKPNNRKMSTCIYMAAISVNDNLMMSLALYNYLLTVVKIHVWYPIECKIAAFLALYALQNTTFQVLAMTVDKYIAIKWPHKAATYSTPKRAKITAVILFSCVFVYNIPHLIISKTVGTECLGYASGGTITKVYSWLSFVLNAIVPFVMLIYMNYVIIKKVRESRKMFTDEITVADDTPKSEICNSANQKRQKSMKNTENQLTIMLLLVTTLFLILMIPTYVRFLFFSFVKRDTPERYANLMLLYHFSYKLYNTNCGINFFLYCISGKKFRNDLKETVCCCFRGKGTSEKYKSPTSVTEVSLVY